MIKIENADVYGWQHAIRGMRNAMESWDKSDSARCIDYDDNCTGCPLEDKNCLDLPIVGKEEIGLHIGENDTKLMQQLSAAGDDHGKYLRMTIVWVDIIAPLYWWSEYDTYKVGTVANSCSKMHKLLAKPFEMSDFSFDKLPGYKNEVKQFRPEITEEMSNEETWVILDKNYDVSDLGRVRHKFANYYRIISGSLHKDGYVFVTLYGKQYLLHRVVAWVFHHENYDEGHLVVNHIDGNKQNNFANNLEWVSQKENIAHSVENNLQPNAVNTYKGKFTEEQRQEIKHLWDSGAMSKREIAQKMGVSHTCISDIINDKYKYAERSNIFEEVAKPLIDTLNELRDSYFICENESDKKQIWYSILQLLPESYNQRRTVMLSYQVLKHMYHARKNHKLDEWREFCKWEEKLPYFKELCIDTEKVK